MKAKVIKDNNSWVASVKESDGSFSKYFVSNQSVRGSVGTVVEYKGELYHIQGYKEDCYLLSTFENKEETFPVKKLDVKHKLDYIKENAFYSGELIKKPTKQGFQFYFKIKKLLSNGKRAIKLEQKEPNKVSEV